MLESFRIENFKCFKDTGPIEIRPITILLGLNSSGKSSILQALLALKQTLVSRDDTTTLITDGDYVKLGTYRDFAHRHSAQAEVAFEWVLPWVDWPVDHPTFKLCADMCPWLKEIQSLTTCLRLRQNAKTKVIYPSHYSLRTDNDKLILHVSCAPSGDPVDFKSDVPRDQWDQRYRRRWLSRENFHFDVFQQRPSPPQYLSEDSHMQAMEQAMLGNRVTSVCYALTAAAFERMLYLAPLREFPVRLSLVGGESPPDVGLRGENTVSMLLARCQTAGWPQLRDAIVHWLEAFKIATAFKVLPIGTGLVSIRLEDPHLKVESSLADVGFGASQVLPVIVQGLCCDPGALLLVEQPEIHLHPDAQGELGDFFIETSSEGKRWLVETHSEHLLLRLQRRIAEDKLRPEDVAVYYVERKRGASHVRRIELDEYGRMPKWPRGFFAGEFHDSRDRAIAAAKKAAAEGGDLG